MLTIGKSMGMLAGLAVGDALGAPLEFTKSREPEDYVTEYIKGGAHDMDIGEWTDDTAMAMAMADAIIDNKGFDAFYTMKNFIKWYDEGKYIPRGECFDIGLTTQRALLKFMEDDETPYKGDRRNTSAGNGGLMRIAPVIIAAPSKSVAITWATQQTLLTHGATMAVMYSQIFAEELWHGSPLAKYKNERHDLDIPRQEVLSGGFVEETYQCAMWAFQTTNTFEDCVIKAVNRGYDSDTCGAVAGMMAGAYYGIGNIPDHLLDNLMWKDHILETAVDLYKIRSTGIWA